MFIGYNDIDGINPGSIRQGGVFGVGPVDRGVVNVQAGAFFGPISLERYDTRGPSKGLAPSSKNETGVTEKFCEWALTGNAGFLQFAR